MRQAAAEAGLTTNFAITVGTSEVPFICDLDYQPFLNAFPETPHTPLFEAVRASLQEFRRQRDLGWLTMTRSE